MTGRWWCRISRQGEQRDEIWNAKGARDGNPDRRFFVSYPLIFSFVMKKPEFLRGLMPKPLRIIPFACAVITMNDALAPSLRYFVLHASNFLSCYTVEFQVSALDLIGSSVVSVWSRLSFDKLSSFRLELGPLYWISFKLPCCRTSLVRTNFTPSLMKANLSAAWESGTRSYRKRENKISIEIILCKFDARVTAIWKNMFRDNHKLIGLCI